MVIGEYVWYLVLGVDLNCLFDFVFELVLDFVCWIVEYYWVYVFGFILCDLDVMLDIYLVSFLILLFVIVNDVFVLFDLVGCIGFEFIFYGWLLFGFLIDKVMVGVLECLGWLGISVECG